MNIIELYCPACNAKLEVADDAAALSCPSCGSKIIIHLPDPGSVSTADTEDKPKTKTRLIRSTVVLLAMVIFLSAGFFFFERNTDQKLEKACEDVESLISDKEYYLARSRLASVEYRGVSEKSRNYWKNRHDALYFETARVEVRHYIDIGDYSQASSALDSFVPPEDKADQWEKVKEALRKEIDEKSINEEANTKKPVSLSSKELEELKYFEAEEKLRKDGFTNISLVKISYKSIWYKPGTWKKVEPGDIKEISIESNGKISTSFKKDNVFPAASKIIISYYVVE